MMEQILKSYLEHICGKNCLEENVPMSTKTTFKIGGKARFYVVVKTKEMLMRLISALKFIEHPYMVIGLGANLLVSDKGYDGVIIRLGFKDILENQCFVYADAGATLKSVCNFAREKSLSGLEWACGIPATTGGAVFMNAGAFGSEIKDVVAMADVLTAKGEIVTVDNKKLQFGYRNSMLQKKKDWIVLGVYFFLAKGDKDKISALENEYLAKRRCAQPAEPSAGSIFKKPTQNFSVGKAIEDLGLKGYSIGGAQVSEKHAGFIVNKGGATANDVLNLIKIIKNKVKEEYKVNLTLEIKKLGFENAKKDKIF